MAGRSLNQNVRVSKTEAEAALQRLSVKGTFGPGDLDDVRKLRQALEALKDTDAADNQSDTGKE